ncbi:MAG TPA: MBL fold metallo-hydrolase [Saprospiraceae bacterium]|nr:MBL fold metallo-hydrolase [Saprospiraceae bacterium]
MVLKILGSNSSGNAYVLQGKREVLLIECGVQIKEVMKAIDFDLDPVKGCIITHNHGDHFKYVDQFTAKGIDIYGSYGTLKDKCNGPYRHRCTVIKAKQTVKIGGFTVYPFDTIHDADESLGYMINHQESGNILFITDSAFTQYKFEGMNHLIVEANHSEEYLREKVLAGKMEYHVYKRLIDSHMSIETCEQLLLANDLTNVNNIVLIHLSDSNSHEERFKKTIEQKTGKNVFIATKGSTINFNLNPF